MPTKKPRLTVSVDEETSALIDKVMKENGILEKSVFLSDAINYYLTSLTTDDVSKTLITKDASNELRRTLNPVKTEISEQNRITQIMLNAIWRKLNFENKILSETELTDLVKAAVADVDENGGMNVTKILTAAKNKMITHENKEEEKPVNVNIPVSSNNQFYQNTNASSFQKESESKENDFNKSKKFFSHPEKEKVKEPETSDKKQNDEKPLSTPYGSWGDDMNADLFSNFK